MGVKRRRSDDEGHLQLKYTELQPTKRAKKGTNQPAQPTKKNKQSKGKHFLKTKNSQKNQQKQQPENTNRNKTKGSKIKKNKNSNKVNQTTSIAQQSTEHNENTSHPQYETGHKEDIHTKTDHTENNEHRSKLSNLQQKMMKKLEGARFRMINEMLYTKTGGESFQIFQKEPQMFEVYHQGFREQVSKWPTNPLNSIINWINKQHKNAVIADFGCGEAQLSASVKNKVYSFDLIQKNERITACDMSNVPLENETVDIVVFCLSLMGTNMMDFVREGHRVLKTNGILKIAEVRSRFEDVKSCDGVDGFVSALQQLGFRLINKDTSNKMFVMMELQKTSQAPKRRINFAAKPCIYKRR